MKYIITESQKKEIDNKMSKEWSEKNGKLIKTFRFESYNEVTDFVNKVFEIAEKQNHHPEIIVKYDSVKVEIFDHSKKSISEKCYKFVDEVNKITQKKEIEEYSRTLKNARKQGAGLKFSKIAIKNNPMRFRLFNKEKLKESDPKIGSGKKPEGSNRRLYTDENPNDTVSVKFRTKEDIVDTLSKQTFKSKPHKRQSQIINLIHQRVRVAYQNAKNSETKSRLKRAYDYIKLQKEKSKQKTIKLKEKN